MQIAGPSDDVELASACERVLRSLPRWFGIESSLLEYVSDTRKFPTFTAQGATGVVGFLTVRQHFTETWEVNCIAVDAALRNQGVGRALHEHVEQWLLTRGARLLQVKTLAAAHPSPEYAETRRFYEKLGYLALEVFPTLWDPRLPVLQLVKPLG